MKASELPGFQCHHRQRSRYHVLGQRIFTHHVDSSEKDMLDKVVDCAGLHCTGRTKVSQGGYMAIELK